MNRLTSIIFIILLVFAPDPVSAQDCKVLIKSLSESYSGDCRKGLANGKGIAGGNGYTFEGNFKKGYPDGEGTLTMPDGTVFTGEWNNGEVYGYGELTGESGERSTGYFKGPVESFRLMGQDKASLAGYRVMDTERLDNATYGFVKNDDQENEVSIMIFENNIRQITNFEILEITSGVIQLITNNGGRLTADITNVNYPVTIGIRYILPYGTQDTNLPGGITNLNSPRKMRFTIYEPGHWTVSITHR